MPRRVLLPAFFVLYAIVQYGVVRAAAAGPDASPGPPNASAVAGGRVFAENCAGCHGANGAGQPGIFPPLAHNAVVTGNPRKVASIVWHGLQGRITVNGTVYDATMPTWGGTLTNQQIADVLTYVRSSWGNNAGPVTAAQVASTHK
ncbi:MAG TPA: cytochrome c [Candidatus Elarobacter sp.]|nr:cytochrome c [Candidatus Elarobacter sp.]